MNPPTLSGLSHWISPHLVAVIDHARRERGEVKRNRKLGTVEILWLMLAVSLDTGRNGLHEILRVATADLDIRWTVSVPAFCKARKRFFPQASENAFRPTGS